MAHEGLTTGEAAKYLRRHPKTLQSWDRKGILPARRTKTGRRYWLRADLDAYLGKTAAVPRRSTVAYCRVSSQAQKPDLKNQKQAVADFCTACGIANVDYVDEVGGGLNFRRKRLLEVIDRVMAGEVERLIVAHRDRLARFGFDLIRHLCAVNDCEVLVIDSERLSPEQEMVQDLMTIMHCFSSRLYGLRNYRKTLRKALSS